MKKIQVQIIDEKEIIMYCQNFIYVTKRQNCNGDL